MDEDRFKQPIITTLAKRAANRCSNPDCGAFTTGPAEDRSTSINVGVAAHIFGARPGSARYNSLMTSIERSSITNAIWLCANCHKMIDDDPEKFPSGLLFEWLSNHEKTVGELIGKAGAELRRKYDDRHLEEFGRLSYLSERIIREKGEYWEYQLTAEILRFEMAPILQQWDALKRGLYMKPNFQVSADDSFPWMQTRLAELTQLTHAFSELLNKEFARAWGEPGTPGIDTLIVSTCRLYSGMCKSAIDWEETVRFSKVDEIFDDIKSTLVGVAGGFIEEAQKLPTHLAKIVTDLTPGKYELALTIALPDGWNEKMESALAKAIRVFERRLLQ